MVKQKKSASTAGALFFCYSMLLDLRLFSCEDYDTVPVVSVVNL